MLAGVAVLVSAGLTQTANADELHVFAAPATQEVVALPQDLEARLHEKVIGVGGHREERLASLVELLFDSDGYALAYDGALTRTVEQAVADRKANCVTFSLMFVALARKAGIDAYVQETDHVLAWQGGNALYGNGHVNVGVKIGRSRRTIDIDRSVVSSRGTTLPISDERALAHFYNNRGAELMEQGHPQAARIHFEAALGMDSSFVGAWNNLGVLHLRGGAPEQAERAYQNALRHKRRYAPTLSNMVKLYRHTGDAARLAGYQKQLFDVQRRDPFHQIVLALAFERAGDNVHALEHYQRAIRLKAREHFVYFGLARAYAKTGDIRRASEALLHARDAAVNERGMYQAKLDRLRRTQASTPN